MLLAGSLMVFFEEKGTVSELEVAAKEVLAAAWLEVAVLLDEIES